MREKIIIKDEFKVLNIEKKSKAKALIDVEVGDVISISYDLNGGRGYAPEVYVNNKTKMGQTVSAGVFVFKQSIAGYELEKLV